MWRQADSGREYHREWSYKRKYGITIAQYDELLASQGGGCQICRRKDNGLGRGGRPKPFAIDHDHKTKLVRGLLCDDCNYAIGALKDDPNLIRAAAMYVELTPWRRVAMDTP